MSVTTAVWPLAGGLDLVTPAISIQAGRALTALNYECKIPFGIRRMDGYTLFDGSADPDEVLGAVPGTGPIRGICKLDDTLIAFRDYLELELETETGVTRCYGYKATAAGWERFAETKGDLDYDIAGTEPWPTETRTFDQVPITPGGTYDFVEHNFYGSGDTGVDYRGLNSNSVYGCDGKNPPFVIGYEDGVLIYKTIDTRPVPLLDPRRSRYQGTIVTYDTGFGGAVLNTDGNAIDSEKNVYTRTSSPPAYVPDEGNVYTLAADGTYRGASGNSFTREGVTFRAGRALAGVRGDGFNVYIKKNRLNNDGTSSDSYDFVDRIPKRGEYQNVYHNSTVYSYYANAVGYFRNNKAYTILRTFSSAPGQTHNNVNNLIDVHGNRVARPVGIIREPHTHEGYEDSGYPSIITAHSSHLFIGYPNGSVQNSGIKDPLKWYVVDGADEIGAGSALTLLSSVQNVLVIGHVNGISLLYGDDVKNFNLQTFARNTGPLPFSQSNFEADLYFFNGEHINNFSTTREFGDFSESNKSIYIQPFIDSKKNVALIGSAVNSTKNQYRLFFADGSVLVGTFLNRQLIGYTTWLLTDIPHCVCDGYIGCENGKVMKMDVGTSFNGAKIESLLRMPFTSLGKFGRKKRFRKLTIGVESSGPALIQYLTDLNYGSIDLSAARNIEMEGTGSLWDTENWDEFQWDTELVGQVVVHLNVTGENIGFFFHHSSATELPFTFQSIQLNYSMRGISR